jgi:hypothetical protein
MIDPLDDVLRDLVQSRVATLAGPTQIGFAPPNADWKAAVVAAGEERLNLYLYDMRENMRLRSNEITTKPLAGGIAQSFPSPRVDCTYLITAWSPVAITPLLDPTREEHAILYRVLAVLMQFRPLDMADVYAKKNPLGHALAGVPAALKAQPLPASVAFPEAVKEPSEFWTTMKVDSRPAIRLTITVPVVLDEPDATYPDVTTMTSRYAQLETFDSTDVVIAIGGRVLNTADQSPIAGAWVQIAGKNPPALTGIRHRVFTDSHGRFIFSRLPRGSYELRAVAAGIGDKTFPPFEVPLSSGTYDVHLP